MTVSGSCPECDGKGYVILGFYGDEGFPFVTSQTENCRKCLGKGYLSITPIKEK